MQHSFFQNSIPSVKYVYSSANVFSTAVPIGDTVNTETSIVNQHKLVRNPKWWQADQLAILKRGQGMDTFDCHDRNPSTGQHGNLTL